MKKSKSVFLATVFVSAITTATVRAQEGFGQEMPKPAQPVQNMQGGGAEGGDSTGEKRHHHHQHHHSGGGSGASSHHGFFSSLFGGHKRTSGTQAPRTKGFGNTMRTTTSSASS